MAAPANTPDLGIRPTAGAASTQAVASHCPARAGGHDSCSKQCRIHYYNAQRGQASGPVPTSGMEATIAPLIQVLTEASRLAAAVSSEVAAAGRDGSLQRWRRLRRPVGGLRQTPAAAVARAADAEAAAEAAWGGRRNGRRQPGCRPGPCRSCRGRGPRPAVEGRR
jgi:hypothetical protein